MSPLPSRAGCALALLALLAIATPARAQTRRVDLQILVVTRGATDGASAMIKAALDEQLVPYTELDLTRTGRPALDDVFLIDSSQPSLRRARFQAVVLLNENPVGMTALEKDALYRFEREFKVRQLDAYVFPSPQVGLLMNSAGTFDGVTANVTAAGKQGPFSYLQGPVPFEDLDAALSESYAYTATPLSLPAGTTYTPFVEATGKGATASGSILGVLATDGREEMVFTAAVNQYMLAQKLLLPGILNWLTHGVHLGLSRMWYAVHVDDVFRESGRWSDSQRCTLNESCGGQTGTRILMSTADVDYLVAWQDRQGMKLDLAFHGGAHAERVDDAAGRDMGLRLIANRRVLRWINHTYNREFMDCTPDFFTGRCAIDAQGQPAWILPTQIRDAITRNNTFASSSQLTVDATELITGDHTGLRRPGGSTTDNPNLLSVLSELKIGWVGANASAEREQRVLVGETRTVPRYPTNLFYNVATKQEEVSLYNFVYTSRLDGGGGSCDPSNTCLKRIDLQTGFDTVIAPRETRIMLMHVLGNDPRPHYVSQGALSEDRLLYPVADGVLAQVRRYFNAAAPLANPTMREAGSELKNRSSYQRGRARVTGYVQAGVLNLTVAAGDTETVPVPVTANLGSPTAALAPYWGLRNGWQDVSPSRPAQFPLAASVPYGR